jgi:hypothetical protein
MVFNATFNNTSVISWWSVLLVEETGVSGENHWPVASHWQTLLHNLSRDSLSYKTGDHFWREVFSQTTSNDTKKYPTVTDVLKMALSLPHGNADVERGLSVNNSIVTKESNQFNVWWFDKAIFWGFKHPKFARHFIVSSPIEI